MPVTPIALSWSSGKDSAWALHKLRQDPTVEVVALFTTYSSSDRRVPLQYSRIELVQSQAEHAGVPLLPVPLPNPCTNIEYESAFNMAVEDLKVNHGITAIAFADLFLADIRAYREKACSFMNITPLFPLWTVETRRLAEEIIAGGLKAYVSAVDTTRLDASLLGREYNQAFLDDLPAECDPCGENGEFHTVAWAGPMFGHPMRVKLGNIEKSEGYTFQDIVPLGRDAGDHADLPVPDAGQNEGPYITASSEEHSIDPAVVRQSQPVAGAGTSA